MADYQFTGEVKEFKPDHFVPFMGWIGDKPYKIYTRGDQPSFFVHDESIDRLFEFKIKDQSRLNKANIYDCLIKAYLAWTETQI